MREPVEESAGQPFGADAGVPDIIRSLERMNVVEAVGSVQRTSVIQAGMILQNLQDAVDAHDLSFPLDPAPGDPLPWEPTSPRTQLGNRVILFGMTSDVVLGLEIAPFDSNMISY